MSPQAPTYAKIIEGLMVLFFIGVLSTLLDDDADMPMGIPQPSIN